MKNGYPLYLFAFLFCLFQLSAFSQRDGMVHGRVQDTTARIFIADATITILQAKDSSLVSFSRSGPAGQFLIKGLGSGNYRLLVTHIGYLPASKNFIINEAIKDFDMGAIALADKSTMLDAVTVEVPPVMIRHDTTEYNAGSFKTKPDAVVEDLLKKLPGIQVDKNGTVKANGEEVKKVLVDGKEFFGNDPKIATRNLPADAIDKVQVFDKKSDQSQFTGFDDGNSQKTINLTVKKDRKHGIFGRMTAGGGTDAGTGASIAGGGAQTGNWMGDGRYEGNLNINEFNGDRQCSAIGMTNNTNKQGFSFQDVLGFSSSGIGGGKAGGLNLQTSDVPIQGLTDNSQAITTTRAGGLNFNDHWHGGHDELHGNYFYNQTNDLSRQNESRQYLLPGNSFVQDRSSTASRHNENQRLTVISDQRIDSFTSLKINSAFTYQNSSNTARSIDSSFDQATGALQNNGLSNAYSFSKGYTWNNSALLRHRFAKKGRTVSVNIQYGLNSNTGGGTLQSVNHYYQPGLPAATDTLHQQYDLPSNGRSYGATLAYTEPLSRRSLLEFNYNFSQTHSRSDKKTFDADGAGKFSLPDAQLTNDFTNAYTYHREQVQFQHQRTKFTATAGITLQQASSTNGFGYLAMDTTLRQSFLNLLPNADLQYNFNGYSNMRFHYLTYTNQPGITQLAPVADNSDPLNIRVGNPALRQEYYHAFRFNYISFDPFRHTSFFSMLSFNSIHHKIVNDDVFDSVGVRISRPVNLDGLYNANGSLSWGLPLRALKSNLNLNSSVRIDHNASFVNGAKNTGNTYALSQEATLNFAYKELLDLTGGARMDYNDARYSLQPGQNQRYWTETYTLDGTWYLPDGFSVASDVDYVHHSGLPAGFNSSPLVWNAGLAKKVFANKKGTIRLQVFDLLRQNTGFSRTTSQNYIDDLSYKTLNRYWLLSFTYALSRFAGKSAPGSMEGKTDIRILR
jgi:Outer membrane protein beta-barrel family/Carboxypeptidase regulatory-like domain